MENEHIESILDKCTVLIHDDCINLNGLRQEIGDMLNTGETEDDIIECVNHVVRHNVAGKYLVPFIQHLSKDDIGTLKKACNILSNEGISSKLAINVGGFYTAMLSPIDIDNIVEFGSY